MDATKEHIIRTIIKTAVTHYALAFKERHIKARQRHNKYENSQHFYCKTWRRYTILFSNIQSFL